MTDEKKFTGWKRTYIGLLNAATVICIIIGCLSHFGGWIGSDLINSFTGSGRKTGTKVSSQASGEAASEAFDTIEGSIAAGSIEIVNGDDYGYMYEGYPEKELPSFQIKGKTLKIEQKSRNKSNINSFKNSYGDARIVITLPKGSETDTDLKLNLGALSAKNVTFGDFSIKADAGSIELEDVTAGDLDIQADMGGITISNSTFNDADVKASMGGIELSDVCFDEASLQADMGGITVSGNINELEAKCSMGGIDVSTDNDDASLDLSADMGGISVNGESVGRKYRN